MDFRDGLSADLPPPRDDEPASLRDDIVDELADHLACMYRRELLRGADASTAKLRVPEAFGDPTDLARRLWFDAMKGKIMSQRILVSCCVFLTLISLTLAGFLWMQVIDSRRMAVAMEARAREEARLAQAAQEEMIRQLAAVSKAVENPRAPDWIPVSFRLTQETLDGPPGVGFQAALGRGTGGSNKAEAIQRDSDSNGMIDFGVVQPGDWEFRISRKLEDRHVWNTQGKLNVGLGNKIEKAIICPRISPVQPELKVRIDWPADLDGKDLAALAVFHHEGFVYQPPLRWTLDISPGAGWWKIAVVKPTKNLGPSFHGERCALLALAGHQYFRESAFALQEPPTDSTNPRNAGGMGLGQKPIEVVPIADSYWKAIEPSHVVKRDQPNKWTIRLPDELTKAVREKLRTLSDK